MLDSLRALQNDNDGFGSQSLRTADNHQCWRVMNMSAVATPNHDLWRVRDILTIFTFVHSTQSLNRGEGLITGRNP
jgi:hypothetical protein